MKYVLASANPGKVKEMRDILSDLEIDVVSRDELDITIDVEETGTTFYQNARLKAEAICLASGMPSIADDSGLIVESLNGEPGVYSSSYGGEGLSTYDHCMYLLDKMKNMEQRRAKFVCIIVCAYPDGIHLTVNGECHGKILTELRGTGGFGYDQVFLPDGYKKSMAELTPEEKNSISHRGAALREFSKLIKSYKTGTNV
jgi:XTP/dITP diphosphohydrolase